MKLTMRLMALFLVVALVAAGCSGGGKSVKDDLQQAIIKTTQADSYVLDASIKITEFSMSEGMMSDQDQIIADQMSALLKDATIQANAVYSKKEERTDMVIEVVLPGFMNMKLDMPMIIVGEKVYFKLPQIPMLPLPQDVLNKYIEVDTKALAAEQGAELPTLDAAEMQKVSQEMLNKSLVHFDEKVFFTKLKASEANLPEDVKADQVIKFAVTEANYGEALNVIVDKVLPEIIETIKSNESLLKLYDLGADQLDSAKTDLAQSKDEIKAFFQDNMKVKKLDHVAAIKSGVLAYQATDLNFEINGLEEEGQAILGMSLVVNYKDVNKEPKFENEIPTDAIPFEEFAAKMNSFE